VIRVTRRCERPQAPKFLVKESLEQASGIGIRTLERMVEVISGLMQCVERQVPEIWNEE
jgi:hypothetical protein